MATARQARGDLYRLECASGLAGDMFLGCCLDLGMPLELLEAAVREIALPGVTVEARRAERGGVGGLRFRALIDGRPLEGPDPDEEAVPAASARERAERPYEGAQRAPVGGENGHGHRSFADIRSLIERSGLGRAVAERSVELFARLAEVEGTIHRIEPERVLFHEVGALDSIVDIVGACVAIEHLAPARLTCGTVVVGGGRARTAHGVVPVPAPATAELMCGIPTVGEGEGELLTPTGALILSSFVDDFGPAPPMRSTGHGYGLGRRQLASRPNAARLTRGEPIAGDQPGSEVAVLETQVDDATGELLGHVVERLLGAGALDVFHTPVTMKKSRPGSLVTVICRPLEEQRLSGMLLTETGSLGCRRSRQWRLEAEREVGSVATRFGAVDVKWARLDGRSLGGTPEYESCRAVAEATGASWREVYRAALAAAEGMQERRGDAGGPT
ncbi:MAG TPA: nickel pincer cofactor biosynthesis protein LarC [Thermoanaerobaculia bacterium]|nr:nickel pincer cofactor biosynthesis protein LarC [Thermoanaerobaculia bacterium]